MDDTQKAIILEGQASQATPARPPRRPGRTPPPRSANLHDMSVYDLIQANLHDLRMGSEGDVDDSPGDTIDPEDSQDGSSESTTLLAHATKRGKTLSPGDLRKVLSTTPGRDSTRDPDKSHGKELVIDGKKYRQVNMAKMLYKVSTHKSSSKGDSLVDRGANGGVGGEDVRVIDFTGRSVDVQGIDNHQVTDIPLATVGAVAESQKGPVILIMHQYAYTGKGRTIHSSGQLELYKNDVNDKSVKVPGGLQRILTNDGYAFPLSIKQGLPYLGPIHPYTDEEWKTLPHVLMTGQVEHDPAALDHTFDDIEDWYDAITELTEDPDTNLFDEFGNYRKRTVVQSTAIRDTPMSYFDAIDYEGLDGGTTIDDLVDQAVYQAHVHGREVKAREPDYDALRPLFGWLPTDIVKRTFEKTTQYARIPMSTILKKHYKSPNPALNVHRRDEPVATDTVYSDTPAVDDGATSAQFFTGTKSLVSDIYGMKTDKQFVNTLEDNIRERGAPNQLISDRAQVEISKRVVDILRALIIGSWQSEPDQQHQNFAERRFQTVKTMSNTILDRTGSPAYTWLLCLMYVCFILNHTFEPSINAVPLQVATGSTPDISPLLRFQWWEPVYYKIDDSDFPSDSREKLGRFVGIAEHVGHAMTYKILTDDTRKVIYRSNVRSALDPSARNRRIDLLNGEPPPKIIKSRQDESHESNDGEQTEPQMPVFSPTDLVGKTFLMDEQEDGQRFRARIVRAIEDHESKLEDNPTRIKFLCSINDDEREEIITYNEILDHIQRDDDDPI